jgi:hypothetical protein
MLSGKRGGCGKIDRYPFINNLSVGAHKVTEGGLSRHQLSSGYGSGKNTDIGTRDAHNTHPTAAWRGRYSDNAV